MRGNHSPRLLGSRCLDPPPRPEMRDDAIAAEVANNSKLRLASIITHVGQGGAQEAILRLSGELRRRGHDVEVWFLYGEAAIYDREPGVQTLLPYSTPGVLGYLRIVIRLAKKLNTFRPDGVITFLPLACVVGQTLARLAGIRARVASQRNPYWTYSPFMRLCDKLAGSIGLYSHNVANSRSVLDSFRSYPRSYLRRMTVVYNGIAWEDSTLPQAEARAKFGLPFDAPVIVNIGRLSKQKNQALLLRVLSQLTHVHLAIAGDGELQDSLLAQGRRLGVEHRVHLLGTLRRSDIPDLLRAADIFVQPSLFEGQSNALLEAMNEGLPVLVSEIPAQVETLHDDGEEPAGMILPLDNLARWTEAIDLVLRDNDLRSALTASARKRASLFSLERMGDGFEQIIRHSIGIAGNGSGCREDRRCGGKVATEA